ncbi:MAG: hypothetical protein FWG89_03675 [Treponema sp.]|nr:hypothetical protein [Treponema sp.]
MQVNNINKTDKIISVVCLAGFIICVIVFRQIYTGTLSKLNEEPVGTIIFKKRTAQRKFVDRAVWDRLGQESYIFNGDTIRTIEFSEAIISFRDEQTLLTIYENTMIQVFYSDWEGARIEFTNGQLEIDSSSRQSVITGSGSGIAINGQTQLSRSNSGFRMSVLEGEAVFNNEKLMPGDLLAVNANGDPVLLPSIAMTSFGSSPRFLAASGGSAAVVFSWNEHNFTSDTHVIVEVSLDRRFNNIVRSSTVTDSSITIAIEHGSYWWRAYPVSGGSNVPANDLYPSGTIEIIPLSSIQLLSPARVSEHDVNFSWTAAGGASAYILEVSAYADMRDPVVSRQVAVTRARQSGLENGHWYWRITPVFPRRITGSHPPSAISDFILQQGGIIISEHPPVESAPEPEQEGAQVTAQTRAARQQPQTARTTNITASGRWRTFIDERSTATLRFTVDNRGVCSIIVGGTPMRMYADRAAINYQHSVSQGKRYTYEFEAWTETGTRSLAIVNPSNYETRLLINTTRRTFTISSLTMSSSGQAALRFLSGNQTGTYYLRIVSITERD